MKGGKAGRKRGATGAPPRPRGKPKQRDAEKRPAGTAPKKGSRKKSYGAVPAAGDE